ncbi:MAG: ABC transporter permease, partial [Opitutales bacterium]|nr:ABC transporter permease [Opitutales bacterium]
MNPRPPRFSWNRLVAVILKEFTQMTRDRLTFAMLAGIPVAQLVLFGYAINSDPKHLPTAIVNGDRGPVSRAIVATLQTSDYYTITMPDASEADANEALRLGSVQFAVHIPPQFEHDLVKGMRPVVFVNADATDPSAASNALAQLPTLIDRAVASTIGRTLPNLNHAQPSVQLRIHSAFNPEMDSKLNVVPGLMGVVLTMTLVIITALAMTRERERGTMENLLSTPVRPFEVLTGKIVPYVLVGYVQVALILIAARWMFNVPFIGDLWLLLACTLVFILANLGVGITFSTFAQNQLQAVQMAFFFFLPSLLLSGFMFPFRGMPEWAQAIGSVLPLTHFLRIVRGIILKGSTWPDIAPEMIPITLFLCL